MEVEIRCTSCGETLEYEAVHLRDNKVVILETEPCPECSYSKRKG
jgi:formate dehydrogenase maturation protein FdhE